MAEKFPKLTKKNQNKPKTTGASFEDYVKDPTVLKRQKETLTKVFGNTKTPEQLDNGASPTRPTEDRILGDTEKPITSVGDLRIKEGQDAKNEIDYSKLQTAQEDLDTQINERQHRFDMPGQVKPPSMEESLTADLFKNYLERNPLANLSNDDLKETRKTVNAILTGKKSIDQSPISIDLTPSTYGETAEEYKKNQYSVLSQGIEQVAESTIRGGLLFAKGIPMGVGTAINYLFDYTPKSEQINRINSAILSDPKIAEAFGGKLLDIADQSVGEKTAFAFLSILGTLPSFGRSAPKTLAPFFNPTKLKNLHGVKKLIGVGQNIAKTIPQMGLQFGVQHAITGEGMSVDPFITGASFGVANSITDAVTESLPPQFRLAKFIKPLAKTIMAGVGFAEGEQLNDLIHGNLKPYEDYIPALINGMTLKGYHQTLDRIQSNATTKIINSDYVKWYQNKVKTDVLNQLIGGSEKRLTEVKNLDEYSALVSQTEKAKQERDAILIEQNALAQKINDLAQKHEKSIRPVPLVEGVEKPDFGIYSEAFPKEKAVEILENDMTQKGIVDETARKGIKNYLDDIYAIKKVFSEVQSRRPSDSLVKETKKVMKQIDKMTKDLGKSVYSKQAEVIQKYVREAILPTADPNLSLSDNIFLAVTRPLESGEASMENFHKGVFGEVGKVDLVPKIMDNGKPVDAAGYYRNMTIQVLKRASGGETAVVAHEDWHFLRDNYLTEAQKEYLDKNTVIRDTNELLPKLKLLDQKLKDGDIRKEEYDKKVSDLKEEQQGIDYMLMIRDLETKDDIVDGQLTDKAKKKILYSTMLQKAGRFIKFADPNKGFKEIGNEMLLGKFRNQAPISEGTGEGKNLPYESVVFPKGKMSEGEKIAYIEDRREQIIETMKNNETSFAKLMDSAKGDVETRHYLRNKYRTEFAELDKLEQYLYQKKMEFHETFTEGKPLTEDAFNKYLGKTKEEQKAHFDNIMSSKDKYGTFEEPAFEKTLDRIKEQFPNESKAQQRKIALKEFKQRRAVQKDVTRQEKAQQTNWMPKDRILNWKEGETPNDAQFQGTIETISSEATQLSQMNVSKILTLPPSQQREQLSYLSKQWGDFTDMVVKKNNMLTETARVLRLGNDKAVGQGYSTAMDNLYANLTFNLESINALKREASRKKEEIQAIGVGGEFEGKKLTIEEFNSYLAEQDMIIEEAGRVQEKMQSATTGDKRSDAVLSKLNAALEKNNYKLTEEQQQVVVNKLRDVSIAEAQLYQHTGEVLSQNEQDGAITPEHAKKYTELQIEMNKKRMELDKTLQLIMPTEIGKALLTDLKLNIMSIQTLATNITNNVGFGLARLQDSLTEGAIRRIFKFTAEITGNKRLQQDIEDLNRRPATVEEMKTWMKDAASTFNETVKTLSDSGLTQEFYQKTEVGMHHRIDPTAKINQARGKGIVEGNDLLPELLNTNKGISAFISRLGVGDFDANQLNKISQKFWKGFEGLMELQPFFIAKGLSTGDRPFYQPEYNKFLTRELMRGGLSETEAKLRMPFAGEGQKLQAHNRALESIYAESNLFSKVHSVATKMLENTDVPPYWKKAVAYASGVVFPFVKIPMNVMKRTVEYTLPIFPLMNGIHQLTKAKDMTGSARRDAIEKGMRYIARSVSGSSYLAVGAILMNLGVLTGGIFKDEKDKELSDKHPMELNVSRLKRLIANGFEDDGQGWLDNDSTLKMQYLGIPGIAMSAGAWMKRNMMPLPLSLELGGSGYDENAPNPDEGLIGKFANLASVAGKTSLKMAYNQTSLYGYDAIMQAVTNEDFSIPQIQYMLATASTAPFVSRTAIDLANYTAGEGTYNRDIKYDLSYDAIYRRMGEIGEPFWDTPSETLPYQYDVTGNKQYSKQGKLLGENPMIDNEYFPGFFIFGKVHKSPEQTRMQELYKKVGDNSVVPPKLSPDISYGEVDDKKEFKLPKDDYEKFQKEVGKQRMFELGNTLEGVDKLDAKGKKEAVRKLINKFNSISDKERTQVKEDYQLK